MADVLTGSSNEYARLDAATEMRHVPCARTQKLLWKALQDKSDLVRYRAAESLLSIHGLFTTGLPTFNFPSVDPGVRAKAVRELRRILSGRPLLGRPERAPSSTITGHRYNRK
jgi:hypothetical protein